MDDDQQFCLRWNNHQSTLISVFDTLLENETLVDCTLAAEGKFLKAHKVVLSACSPYFATLLQEQYDKHPIFILKDVKYQELRAMMDYMYRGEVNISQDQLAALLKAAESLQIKGLSDNRTGGGSAPKPESTQQQQHHRGKLSGAYTLEQTKRARLATGGAMDASGDVSGSREGSSSPSRRRRKVRRRSMENDAHDNSNSSVLQAVASNQSILQQTGAGLAVSALVSTQLSSGSAAGTSSQASNQQQQPLTSTNVTKKTESAKLTSSTAAPASGTAASVSAQQQQAQQAQTTSDAINTENVQAQSQGGAQGGVEGDDEDMDEASAVGGASAISGPNPASASASAAVHTGVVVKQLASVVDKSSSNHKQQKIKDNSVSSVGSEMVIEPKAEYDDDAHDENVEDLTLDEEDMTMEELDQTAGTSQGGEGSSQTYAWQHDRSQDELGLMAQDAQQRDPQDLRTLYCNYATAVIAAANAASKKPAMEEEQQNHLNQQQHHHHHQISNSNSSEVCEPEVTIRRMYKCGNSGQAEHIVNHLQPAAVSQNQHQQQLHGSASNCTGCHMSAAAASFQLANLLNTSIRSTSSSKPQRNHSHSTGNNSNASGNSNTNATNNRSSSSSSINSASKKPPSVQFHCEFCNFSCSWRYDLKLHLRQKHGIHQLKKV
ncbi:longitudinals lacking protein, isoforms H/M/V isoform X10 [Drosophila kikkawai]|uniref:Longitudinals lacking protein, isoforms H/M/V isoform X10 n=1 Tax=Drosophila kikkawai TaxID=30033 RepID=A0A6P4IGY0_DROKI|nr:longitudinals lacking protein, isoforms H/M/V isoform X10 [Drosophila kikkawai]